MKAGHVNYMTNDKRPKVLVIEDNPDFVTCLEDAIVEAGWEFASQRDGLSGIEAIKWFKPDAVILDISLPQLDGLSVLRMIREELNEQNIVIMILTNYDSSDVRETAKKYGASEVFLKLDTAPSHVIDKVSTALAVPSNHSFT